MRRVVLLLVIAALLAGCAQPAPAVTENEVPTIVKADPFHPSVGAATELSMPTVAFDVLLDQPGFAEPNIAAAYDGSTLYIANPGRVYRSDDAGKTWNKGTSVDGGGDGDISVDENGTVYYLGLFGPDNKNIPFSKSYDKGETWTESVDVSAGSGSDREWLDVTPDGKIFATWRGVANATPGSLPFGLDGLSTPQIEFNGSPDGGETWTGVVRVGPDGDAGPVVHDPVTGALAVAVADFADLVGTAQPVVHVYVSKDQGATWEGHDTAKLGRTSPVEPNPYATDFPVAAFDGDGALYLVYSADSATFPGGVTPPEEIGLYGIYLQVSQDLGETWSAPQLISDPSKAARFPWIAAGSPGRLAVVWYENVRGVPAELLPDEWNVKLYESIDGGATGVVATLTKTPNHLGSLCTSGTGCLAADRSLLDFFEVAIALDGQPIVAYASSTLGTGFGVAVKPTEIYFVTVTGTSLL